MWYVPNGTKKTTLDVIASNSNFIYIGAAIVNWICYRSSDIINRSSNNELVINTSINILLYKNYRTVQFLLR